MNVRRQKLAGWIAFQTAQATPTRAHEITNLRMYNVREPSSKRAYTVVRASTRSGLTGWGEAPRVDTPEFGRAGEAIVGRSATAYAATPNTGTSLDAALDMAMIDIAAKVANAPAYRLLGGPTRHKVRALAALHGETDAELKSSLTQGMQSGYRAFQVPIPVVAGRNQGQAFDLAARARMETLRAIAPANVDFVLQGSPRLMASDAATVAASLESHHLLWFDEPCPVANLRTIRKISDECVTPLGFGREVREPSVYQDLLREGLVDIIRPSITRDGISRIRQIATLAETYYVAVAPNHDGGPIATAAALHLAASLPNFFIQHIPWPEDERDRRMRSEIVSQSIETPKDGFLALPTGSGLGIEVNEAALTRYAE
jgi:galactonate dehydratase